eukprot:1134448-Lingulodinium_polyedra.AAC.2
MGLTSPQHRMRPPVGGCCKTDPLRRKTAFQEPLASSKASSVRQECIKAASAGIDWHPLAERLGHVALRERSVASRVGSCPLKLKSSLPRAWPAEGGQAEGSSSSLR